MTQDRLFPAKMPSDMIVDKIFKQFLSLQYWSRIARTCTLEHERWQKKLTELKDTCQKQVRCSGAIPADLLDDPLFHDYLPTDAKNAKRNPMRWNLLHNLITQTDIIRKYFFNSYQANWQLAALMGLEEVVFSLLGKEAATKVDGHGFGVEHYYAMGGHAELMRLWIIRFKVAKNNSCFELPSDKLIPLFSSPAYYRTFATLHDPDYDLAIVAASAGHVKVLDILITEFGYDQNWQDPRRNKGLIYYAVKNNQIAVVDYLHNKGVKLTEGICLPTLAAMNQHWQMYDYLFNILNITPEAFKTYHDVNDAKTTLKKRQRSQEILLIAFAGAGQCFNEQEFNRVKQLLIKKGLNCAHVNHNDLTILSAAVCRGDQGMVRYLINNNLGQLTQTDPEMGRTLLHVAASAGRPEMIAFLCELQSEITLAQGITPEFILNPLATDNMGNTLLHCAAEKGRWDAFLKIYQTYFQHLTLTDNQAIPCLNIENQSFAHCAAYHGQLYFLRKLVETFGAHLLDGIDSQNNSVLHYACQSGCIDLVGWLIFHQRSHNDLLLINNERKKPLFYLVKNIINEEAPNRRREELSPVWPFIFNITQHFSNTFGHQLIAISDGEDHSVENLWIAFGPQKLLEDLNLSRPIEITHNML